MSHVIEGGVGARRVGAAPRRAAILLAFIASLLVLAGCERGDPEPPPPPPDQQQTDADPPDDEAGRMAGEHRHDRPDPSPALDDPPAQPVVSREVTYGTLDDEALEGYVAWPEAGADGLPGLIVIHEWWGLNDNIRRMTDRLAGEGYVALAVDLYGGRTTDDPSQAEAYMGELMAARDRGRDNVRAAHTWLRDEYAVPAVGSVGWCLGGTWALETALAMPDAIDAVVIYYGFVPDDPELLAPLDMPILGLFAEDDAAVPADDARAFERVLAELGKNAHIEIYPDVDHAFANPSGGNYEPETAMDAWRRTVAFFDAHLAAPDDGGE